MVYFVEDMSELIGESEITLFRKGLEECNTEHNTTVRFDPKTGLSDKESSEGLLSYYFESRVGPVCRRVYEESKAEKRLWDVNRDQICTSFKYRNYFTPSVDYSQAMYDGTLWGMLTSIDLFGCDSEKIDSEKEVNRFAVELCDLIDMKRYGECQVYRFGSGDKEGLSFLQLIETSLISGHLSNDLKSAYIDCFSCKYYDPEVVAEFAGRFFGAKEVRMNVTPRYSRP